MAATDPFKDWNKDAVAKARELLQRGVDLAAQTALLGDTTWAIFFSRNQWIERRRVLEVARKLRSDLASIELEIVDYWRVNPSPNQGLDPNWFNIQMSTRAIVRDIVLHYANDSMQTIHDNQLRVIARATLWVSLVILVVSFAGAVASYIPLFSDRESAAPVAPAVAVPAELPAGKCFGHPSNDLTRNVIVTCDDIPKASKE